MNILKSRFLSATILSAAFSVAPLAFSEEAAVNVEELIKIDSSEIDRSSSAPVASYADSLDRVRPAVVSVYSTMMVRSRGMQGNPLLRRFGDRFGVPEEREVRGAGSGVIVSENGYILTNNHVIEGAAEVKIKLGSGKEYEAKIVGTDPRTDVAVLKVEADSLPHAKLADSDNLKVGDVVFAIGNPLDVGQTVTMGIVSAKSRNNLNMIRGGYENFIQTDASINRGNSGGALVDATGRLVGINTMILTDGRTSGNIGIGFAVPTRLAYGVLSSLVETGSVMRGFLGVGIQDLSTEDAEWFGLDRARGAIVTEVTPGTPADAAGVLQSDVILKIDDEEVESMNDLRLKISQKRPGTEISIGVLRDKKEIDLTAKLVELDGPIAVSNSRDEVDEQELANGKLIEGVMLAPLARNTREEFEIDSDVEGLLVAGIDPDSPHKDALIPGVVIFKINGTKVTSISEARSAIISGKRNMLLIVYRGAYRFVGVDLE